LKQPGELAGPMATERKFSRFNPVARAMTTHEIPESGFCLSAFLVIGESGHPENILMGHLDPAAPWDHVGALDPERAEANSKGWMLPSSHLMIGESPQAAAERILKEQLGLPALPLKGRSCSQKCTGRRITGTSSSSSSGSEIKSDSIPSGESCRLST